MDTYEVWTKEGPKRTFRAHLIQVHENGTVIIFDEKMNVIGGLHLEQILFICKQP